MKYFISLLLMLLVGCQNEEKIFSEQEFTEQFKTVLLEKGLEVKEVESTGLINMQGKLPLVLEVSQNGKNPDSVYIFSFSSAKEAQESLEVAKFATATETPVDKYRNQNIVIIHYVDPPNIGELDVKVGESVDIPK